MTTVPEATDRTEQAERVLMPAAGGPKHGAVLGIRRGSPSADVALAPQWTDSPGELQLRQETYDVKKFVAIMPGRTDRQAFKVLVHPTAADDVQLTWQTVIEAWAAGWSPPPETSEAWATFSLFVPTSDPNAWRP